MDIGSFREVRFFRVASHNGNSSAFQGVQSASNFTVVIPDEFGRVGQLAAFSVENVTFPNLFPNVTSQHNEILVRHLPTNADGFTAVLQQFLYLRPNGTQEQLDVVNAPFVDSSVDWVPILNFDFGGDITVTIDAFGAFTFTSNVGPINLIGANWTTVFGIPPSQLDRFATTWIGYPYVIDSIVIPVGFYDQLQLAVVIEGLLNALPWSLGGFDVSIVPMGQNNFYVITNNLVNFTLIVRQALPGAFTDYRQLLYQMGFQVFPSSLYSTLQAILNPTLQGEQVVYLHSSAVASAKKAFSGEGLPDSLVATIPMWGGYGDVVMYSLNQWESPAITYERTVTPNEFDFSLKNIYDEFLDIGFNQNMTVTFRFFFK